MGWHPSPERRAKASRKLKEGDKVSVTLPPPTHNPLTPEEMPLSIVYEDSDLVVLDKPAGLPVHPSPGHPSHTLLNAVLARFPELATLGDSMRPGIVHRLDKDTSGLMLIARNQAAYTDLVQQIKGRSVVRRYLALVQGHLSPERGTIEASIGRDPRNRKRMAVVLTGKDAITHYRVVAYLDDYTLIEAKPETGRTHQIRVHLQAIGHPVFGDALYGKRSPILGRQFLHACYLGFGLPSSGEFVEFQSELPLELEETLSSLK